MILNGLKEYGSKNEINYRQGLNNQVDLDLYIREQPNQRVYTEFRNCEGVNENSWHNKKQMEMWRATLTYEHGIKKMIEIDAYPMRLARGFLATFTFNS